MSEANDDEFWRQVREEAAKMVMEEWKSNPTNENIDNDTCQDTSPNEVTRGEKPETDVKLRSNVW